VLLAAALCEKWNSQDPGSSFYQEPRVSLVSAVSVSSVFMQLQND